MSEQSVDTSVVSSSADNTAVSEAPVESRRSRVDDSMVYVEEFAMPAFLKRLEALNKKAVAFGLDPIRIVSEQERSYKRETKEVNDGFNTFIQSRMVELKPGEVEMYPIIITEMQIEYPQIKLGNWQVVGKLEALDGQNLMFSVSQQEDDKAALRERAAHPVTCDHCKVKRNRNDGYVLRDDAEGKYMQVGSNCLKDFTGIDPGAALLMTRMYDLVRVADEDFAGCGGSGNNRRVDTKSYLAAASFCVEHFGFVSTKRGDETGETPTYQMIGGLGELFKKRKDLRERYEQERDANYAKAAAICEWIANKRPATDFDYNVQILLKGDTLLTERKHLATAAAVLPSYNRHLEKLVAHAASTSAHVGEVGKKLSSVLTVQRIIEKSGYMPDTLSYLVIMKDAAGNDVLWKTGTDIDEMKERKGQAFEAAFKIKAHGEYQGISNTNVTHLKVLKWLEADKSAEQDAQTVAGQNNAPSGPVSQPVEQLPAHDVNEPAAVPVPQGWDNMHISLYLHTDDSGIASNAEVDRMPIDANKLEGLGVAILASLPKDERSWRAAVSPTAEYVWYLTGTGDEGQHYALHVHDIDGRDLVAADYRQIERLLRVAGVPELDNANNAQDGQPEIG